MSEPLRVALVGSTGLIGGEVMHLSVGREDIRLVAIARREAPLPAGARMEMFVADPAKWGEVFEAIRPTAVICALGTTIKTAGSQAAFRAVDFDANLAVARAAVAAGVRRIRRPLDDTVSMERPALLKALSQGLGPAVLRYGESIEGYEMDGNRVLGLRGAGWQLSGRGSAWRQCRSAYAGLCQGRL